MEKKVDEAIIYYCTHRTTIEAIEKRFKLRLSALRRRMRDFGEDVLQFAADLNIQVSDVRQFNRELERVIGKRYTLEEQASLECAEREHERPPPSFIGRGYHLLYQGI